MDLSRIYLAVPRFVVIINLAIAELMFYGQDFLFTLLNDIFSWPALFLILHAIQSFSALGFRRMSGFSHFF